MTALIGTLVVAGLVLTYAFRDVSRARVEKFARRTGLVVTPGNGSIVIAYLATTRRWRGCGLVASFVIVGIVMTVPGRQFHPSGFSAFVGWFIGALIAEWRVNSLSRTGRRAATLQRRRLGDYVPGMSLVLAAASLTACLAFAGAAVAVGSNGLVAVGWLVLAVALAAALTLVARQVLNRAQPIAGTDVLLADDAVRSRSLQVITGAGMVLFGAISAVVHNTLLIDSSTLNNNWWTTLQIVAIVGLPLFGLLVALSGAPSRRTVVGYAPRPIKANPAEPAL